MTPKEKFTYLVTVTFINMLYPPPPSPDLKKIPKKTRHAFTVTAPDPDRANKIACQRLIKHESFSVKEILSSTAVRL